MNCDDRLIEFPIHMVFRICKLQQTSYHIVTEEIGKGIKSNSLPNIIQRYPNSSTKLIQFHSEKPVHYRY